MSTLIGQLPYFVFSYNDWQAYTERLEQYFEVNEITGEKRKAILLTSLGDNEYKTLRDLCHPLLPKDKTFDELIALLDKQYVVRKSVYRERVAFYTAKQDRFEKIAAWFVRLKNLSMDCQFGANAENVLLDRFITGLHSSAILDRLCEEDETLTLAKAVEIATAKESCASLDVDDEQAEPGLCALQASETAPKKKNRRKKKKQVD